MIGQTLGRYAIDAKLGEGGMGLVYRGRDTQLGRIVALKVLPPDQIVDAARKQRFLQEAKAASALTHPNIVAIYDLGSDRDIDYIVMEYVDGTTLDRRIPTDGLPAGQALAFAVPIADALARAHGAGIVHRDLKPANVMVTEAGAVKVLDFGVAKLLEPADGSAVTRTAVATEAGVVVGSAAYMSPEQADGRTIDARSDIFSFGSVLYEMVTGRRAFTGSSSLSVLAKVLNDEPTVPSQVAAVSADLEKVILRCLRKDPARRFQTMADLKVALEDLRDESGSAPQLAIAARPRSRWAWAAAVAVAVATGAAAYLASRSGAADPAEPMQAVPLTSLSGQVRFPAFSPDGEHIAFQWTGAGQNNQDIYVQQVGAGTPLRLTTDAAVDSSPAWAPDGKAVAFLRRREGSLVHEVRVVPPLGGPERKLAELRPANAVYRPLTIAWCPDSSCLVVPDSQGGGGRSDALFLLPLDGSAKRQVSFPRQGPATDSDPALSPDGRWLVFRRDLTPFTAELHRVALTADRAPAGESTRLTDARLNGARPAWLPDSRRIVFNAHGSLWQQDPIAITTPARLPYVGLDGTTPAVSGPRPDGLRLAYVRLYSDSNLWRIDTSAPGVPAATPPRMVVAATRLDHLPSLSPDGSRLAFFSNRSGEHELWVANPDGANAVQLTTLAAAPGYPMWSPDGHTIAFHSDPEGHPDVLTIPADGGQFRVLLPGPRGGGYPSYSRDGRSIYFTGPDVDGQLKVLKVSASGGTPVAITAGAGVIPLESYDGRDVYYLEAAERPSAVWRMPTAGGAATKVLDGVLNGAYDVVERGIYYLEGVAAGSPDAAGSVPGSTRLRFFDFATRRSTTVAGDLGRVAVYSLAVGLTASRDGRTVIFARLDASADELMLVEHFR